MTIVWFSDTSFGTGTKNVITNGAKLYIFGSIDGFTGTINLLDDVTTSSDFALRSGTLVTTIIIYCHKRQFYRLWL